MVKKRIRNTRRISECVKDRRMTKEIYEYFKQRSKDVKFITLHWHLLNFKSKEEVDQWINLGNNMGKMSKLQGKDRLPDDDDDF